MRGCLSAVPDSSARTPQVVDGQPVGPDPGEVVLDGLAAALRHRVDRVDHLGGELTMKLLRLGGGRSTAPGMGQLRSAPALPGGLAADVSEFGDAGPRIVLGEQAGARAERLSDFRRQGDEGGERRRVGGVRETVDRLPR